MSAAPSACPSSEVLEAVAAGRPATAILRDHLENCGACQRVLRRMEEDNHFLSSFAIDGALPALSSPPRADPVEIPGYDIAREIHRGGQGIVYQAVQRSTKRAVAI